ncbi:MAG: diguanylate cyclase domain-containing protein [Aeromonas sp.]
MRKSLMTEVIVPLDQPLLTAAINLLTAGVWCWSEQTGLRRDPSCLALIGLQGLDSQQLSWIERVHPDDVHRLEDAFIACHAGGQRASQVDYRILHQQGHYVQLAERIACLDDGRLLGVVQPLHSSAFASPQPADPITGFDLRADFTQQLEARLLGESGTFCLLQFSVDHQEKLRQQFGELEFDAMIAKLARIVRQALRREDRFARWDENQFMLLIPHINRSRGLEIAERLRLEIANAELLVQRPVTISLGLVPNQAGESVDHLLARLTSCHNQAAQQHNLVVG